MTHRVTSHTICAFTKDRQAPDSAILTDMNKYRSLDLLLQRLARSIAEGQVAVTDSWLDDEEAVEPLLRGKPTEHESLPLARPDGKGGACPAAFSCNVQL